jgi:hypothetical protein
MFLEIYGNDPRSAWGGNKRGRFDAEPQLVKDVFPPGVLHKSTHSQISAFISCTVCICVGFSIESSSCQLEKTDSW